MLNDKSNLPVALWLLICCLTIFSMVILGGVTRLTGSGLSMVEWAPLMGALPPLTQEAWENVFQLYQQYPEYKLKNHYMTLSEFKGIFWFEYAHRVLGRLIGLLFSIPLIYFIITKRIEKPLIPKMITLFILGGLQGLLGWYMVKSGLVNDPHVSQYRLTAHFGLAIVIYSYLFWVALDLLSKNPLNIIHDSNDKIRRVKRFSIITSIIIFITMLSGGFVAGLKAGYAYNTFPLMNGQWIPDGLFNLTPLWSNFFDNVTTVQFDHRVLATIVFISVISVWFVAQKAVLPSRIKIGLNLFILLLVVQVTLGISTLILVVPVTLAAAHQAGALALLTCSLFVTHELKSL
jgi:cytochrome c oxidase assembly protein subunit 15